MVRFAVLEIATLLDGRGKYSLGVQKNQKTGKYYPNKNRARKFLKTLSEDEFCLVYKRLEKLFEKNSTLVSRILITRHEKIAHASVSRYEYRKNHLRSVRFPSKRFIAFSGELGSIFAETAFGFFDGIDGK